jgi:hypothetical protein
MRIEWIVRRLDDADEFLTPLRRAASPAGLAAGVVVVIAVLAFWPGFTLSGLVLAGLLPLGATAAYHLAEIQARRRRIAPPAAAEELRTAE